MEAGTRLLVDHLRAGLGEPTPQVGETSYAAKIGPEDLHIDWTAPADRIHRQVRVGGAWTTRDGDRIKLFSDVEVDCTALLRQTFASVALHRPPSTRKGSSEIYAVARGVKPGR